jgi:hypothetical protein
MTDQYTSLSLAALKEIAAGVDHTLAIFKRQGLPLSSAEEDVRAMLQKLRLDVQTQLDRHPDNRR